MNKKIVSLFSVFVMMLGLVTACGSQGTSEAEQVESKPTASQFASENSNHPASATAELYNAQKEKIGTAQFTETKQGVEIHLKASKLSPGKHGFHIHETGKCTPPDFKSAGEHFNPTSKEHGFENPQGFHAGDLPNIEVGQDGMVETTMVTKKVTLQKGKPNSLFDKDGSALVIHAKPDDYKTNPAGAAGKRVACGVIKPAKH
ncbi:superoxide dismutase family protein [Pseudalkalibacillus decolorationis]|uniref:superoxide dismutase family protein n=1 Tax=Pseudalkalibacillus decolorationis TaxID=163879 RepID=UPI0021487E65|nr:superoxide dismutase family protein [Pseudalkalibacillus decolorationis]